MKFYIPFKKWFITQPFAQNFNTYYAESGYKGHTGMDIVAMGDKTIYASCDGYIYSHINKDNPDLMRYRAVYQLVEDNGMFYEMSYGHADKILVEPGTYVKRGDPLMTQGNTGDVATGGVKVTLDMKKKALPNMPGEHLHWQVREVLPVDKIEKGKKYLTDAKGTFKKDGKYFEVLNYNNGYAGCIDFSKFVVYESAVPTPITEKITEVFKPQFKRVLRYGSRGTDVKNLQKLLKITPDGIFGVNTRKAVMEFQKANNLIVDGIAGAQTLTKLLSTTK